MNILYNKNKKKFITYHRHNATKRKAPFVIFHHGLMSDMNGSKALHIENHCKEHDYNFIRFDNFGHGKASGLFTDQTISSWFEGLNLVINELTQNQPILLIGSSMGAWITMLKAINHAKTITSSKLINTSKENKFSNTIYPPKKIIGMIGISAAPDFTEELIWNKMTPSEQKELTQNGIINITGDDPKCNHSYPVNLELIKDGRKNLLLNKEKINISCPVHLIHGMCDSDVNYNISARIASKISSNNIILKLIKDGTHSLSRGKDLAVICNSIEEIISLQ